MQNIRILEHRTATQHQSREQFNIRTKNIKTFIIRKKNTKKLEQRILNITTENINITATKRKKKPFAHRKMKYKKRTKMIKKYKIKT